MNTIDIILSPRLIPSYTPDDDTVYVMADILRASSTIVQAFENGVKAIYPLETVEEARAKAKQGCTVGAERNVVKCDFATLGNDPLEYTRENVEGKEIYFTTTNGTRTINACFAMKPDTEVVIGSFTNLNAVADYCRDKNVLVAAAGWKGKVSLEDALYGAALATVLEQTHKEGSDAVRMIKAIYSPNTLIDQVKNSDHYARLVAAHRENAFSHCLQQSLYDVVPVTRLMSSGDLLIQLR